MRLFDSAGPPVSLSSQKVYGEPLLAHLSKSNREIAAPIQECISMLLRTGMREEVRMTALPVANICLCFLFCRTFVLHLPYSCYSPQEHIHAMFFSLNHCKSPAAGADRDIA